MGVNLWGESPHDTRTKGIQSYRMLPKVRADGKGVSARMGPEEAGWQDVRADGQKPHRKA